MAVPQTQERDDLSILLDTTNSISLESMTCYIDSLVGEKVVDVFGMPVESDGKLVEAGNEANTYGIIANKEKVTLTSSASVRKFAVIHQKVKIVQELIKTEDHSGSSLSLSAIKSALTTIVYGSRETTDSEVGTEPSVGGFMMTELVRNTALWMEPMSGDVLYEKLHDNLELNVGNPPVYATDSFGCPVADFDGSSTLSGEISGEPFGEKITGSFWLAFRVEDTAGSNQRLVATTDLGGRGFYVNFNNGGTFAVTVRDTSDTNKTVSLGAPANLWRSSGINDVVIVVDHDNGTAELWVNGFCDLNAGTMKKDYDILLPFNNHFYDQEPSESVIIADYVQSGTSLPYTGKLMVAGGSGAPSGVTYITHGNEIEPFFVIDGHNKVHLRNYDDLKLLQATDVCHYVESNDATTTSVMISVCSTKKVIIDLYTEAGTFVATSGQLDPNIAKHSHYWFTGLTANTRYVAKVKDPNDGNRLSRHQCYAKTLQTDIDTAKLVVLQCMDLSDSSLVDSGTFADVVAEDADAAIINSDWGYLDVNTSSLAEVTITTDTSDMNDFINATISRHDNHRYRFLNAQIQKIAKSIGDHDVGKNDGQMSDAVVGIGLNFQLARWNVTEHSDGGFNYSFIWDDFRFIVFDSRSQRTTGVNMAMPDQITWLKNEISAAETANQKIVIIQEATWDDDPADLSGSQTWGRPGVTDERTDVWNTINGVENSVLSLGSDIHKGVYSNTDKQSAFDTGGLAVSKFFNPGQLIHAFTDSFSQGDTFGLGGGTGYGVIQLSNNTNDTDVDITMKHANGDTVIPTFTLNRPT